MAELGKWTIGVEVPADLCAGSGSDLGRNSRASQRLGCRRLKSSLQMTHLPAFPRW